METLCGQAYGARKYDMLGVYLQRSTILLGVTGVLLTLIYVFCNPILIFLGQSPEIASAAALFWSNTTNFHACFEFPDPEIPPSAEHCGTKCLHFFHDIGVTSGDKLGGSLQNWAGIARGVTCIELVVVDYSDRSICVYCKE